MKIFSFISFLLLFIGCAPETPMTSTITVDADIHVMPVNQLLYGLTIEEINHAVDGGLYAELIQNRNFEDGIAPLNCPVDFGRRTLTTPNGWTMPFIRPDSVPGWRSLNKSSFIRPDGAERINEKTGRSLAVMAIPDATSAGGVSAYGYNGIPLVKNEKYELTFYVKTASMRPKTVKIGLADSIGSKYMSEIFEIQPVNTWKKYHHSFTATGDTNDAQLIFSSDSSMVFWLDMVSLFPHETWNSRANGLRPEVMKLIKNLNPAFIRFPGGSFVEGYTLGTFPVWDETVGPLAERKHFWNIWAYGTTNGVGYHEYLQMCEDLGAEPIYVINSGVTNQARRPRYEDITNMSKLVENALDAIGYAVLPKDSILGIKRAQNGHANPFNLKYVEIGSENYGQEYAKRFNLFKKAINEKYPDITVLSSSPINNMGRHEWTDRHLYTNESFMIGNSNRYSAPNYSRRHPFITIGEFRATGSESPGSMRAAVAEAAFLIGTENEQDVVKRIALAPIIGNTKFAIQRFPAILYNGKDTVLTPSYYMYRMLTNNRGEEVLRTNVNTYMKPQITFGSASIHMFDNSYSFRKVMIDDNNINSAKVLSGNWKVDNGELTPAPNKWNYILMGDSSLYNYTFQSSICRTKGSGIIEFRVRDNGLSGEKQDYVGFSIGNGKCDFFRQSGNVRDTLCSEIDFSFQSNSWYDVKIECADEKINFYVNNSLLKSLELASLPSLIVSTSLDKTRELLIMKVVNTTQHEEKTQIDIRGVGVHNSIKITELSGEPDKCNTFGNPTRIRPVEKKYTFSLSGPKVYNFAPNSITILEFRTD